MGCGASTQEVTAIDAPVTVDTDSHGVSNIEKGTTRTDNAKQSLEIAEADAIKAKAGNETFIASVLRARAEVPEDVESMSDCCTRLQAHNQRLKAYVAIYDCETVKEAMSGGFMSGGVNDRKLIACLCTRSKKQLWRARKQYREMFNQDMRTCVKESTDGVFLTGSYARLMYFAMASADEYVADIIDLACGGSEVVDFETGVDETTLLELFVTHTQAELQAGKKVWEGRRDGSLIDHLNKRVGSSYRHLRALLLLLLKGDLADANAPVDEEAVLAQVATLKGECDKGWFEDFDESAIISVLGGNSLAQNQRVATLYENTYNESLSKALKGKCGDRLHYCLAALLLPKPDFIAMRLHAAMGAWSTSKKILTRLLGGLDGAKMLGVTLAYETKYSQPLWSALKAALDGSDFLHAALTWLRAINEPTHGAEAYTEVEVASLGGDASKLCTMVDW